MFSGSGCANAAAMREDQIALQGRDVGRVDLDRGEFAEAGVDAVDGRVAGGDFGDAGGSLEDAGIEGCDRALPALRSSRWFRDPSSETEPG